MGAYMKQGHGDNDCCAALCGSVHHGRKVADLRQKLRRIAENLWWWLRQVSGDADYENYMLRGSGNSRAGGSEHRVCGGRMSAEEFYIENLRRKHSRINRCC